MVSIWQPGAPLLFLKSFFSAQERNDIQHRYHNCKENLASLPILTRFLTPSSVLPLQNDTNIKRYNGKAKTIFKTELQTSSQSPINNIVLFFHFVSKICPAMYYFQLRLQEPITQATTKETTRSISGKRLFSPSHPILQHKWWRPGSSPKWVPPPFFMPK